MSNMLENDNMRTARNGYSASKLDSLAQFIGLIAQLFADLFTLFFEFTFNYISRLNISSYVILQYLTWFEFGSINVSLCKNELSGML